VRSWRAFFLVLVLSLPRSALALAPENLLLIVNKNVPDGQKLAEYYSKARHVPDGRILALDLPTGDEVSFDQYETVVVPCIRKFIRDNRLQSQITCLVTFYGVPLKIGGRTETARDKHEIAELNQMLADAARDLAPIVERGEKLASDFDASFTPLRGDDIDALARRVEHVGQFLQPRVARLSDSNARDQIIAQFNQLVEQFSTPADSAEAPTTSATSRSSVGQRLRDFDERRFDPDARREMRDLAHQELGQFRYARILAAQRDYLLGDSTDAALDNELPLLWWSFYRRMRWEPNPTFYRFAESRTPRTVMVMRLDAPKPEQLQAMIDTAVKVEAEGLKGKVVLDSGGGKTLDPSGKSPLYREYDRSLERLASLLRTSTTLTVELDTGSELLAPNSFDDVAIYCGWYSPGKYVPCVKLVSGSVGFHVASYEMVSLHDEKNAGWCRGLLNDGIDATIGPVAEPYLHAFPLADEFFPLLLTGKLTLADVYWRTTPLASWRMAVVGDPLYTPFKSNPALRVEDLPVNLRSIFARPASRPVEEH
jgi:uncharacterized protein (TIGR03790 family)